MRIPGTGASIASLAAALLAAVAIGCGDDDASDRGGSRAGPPDTPVKIRMG